MKKEILNQFANPDWILVSFLLFFVVFMVMLVRVFTTTAKEHQKNSLIPLYEKPSKKGNFHERK